MGINYDTTQQDCCKNDRLLKYFYWLYFTLLHAVQFFNPNSEGVPATHLSEGGG